MSELTPEIIRAAAWDAGDRSMRQAGRTQWNEDDYNAACNTFDNLIEHESQPDSERS